MIVYEHNDCFVMIRQHEHALLSGQLAKKLNRTYWPDLSYQYDVLYAIHHHDRGWKTLDSVPIWNDDEKFPFSFMDYPLPIKLDYYQKGIEEVLNYSSYAAYLCSKHYQSFFKQATSRRGVSFYNHESKRQKDLLHDFEVQEDLFTFHFQLLQFFDDLSLYVCFQEPGVTKENELTWFKEGFSQSFYFLEKDERILANWKDDHTIQLSHPLIPTDERFSIQIKRVPKELVQKDGIASAYEATSVEHRTFQFSPPKS
ncbi:DUF3891 family protein [Alkalihalobacillus sp. CinArs1]|uniref:DUF3891 family protein n=1 Tax=Alkalihalobacillus sp. CinArs1 TaxID=2995314 RepID=UPI0022DDF5C8|nr:DUF3891 family protein [Alkalihalobacillus sp. CinArs1]